MLKASFFRMVSWQWPLLGTNQRQSLLSRRNQWVLNLSSLKQLSWLASTVDIIRLFMTILDVSCRWSTRHQNKDLVADHHHFHKKRSCDLLDADQHFHQVEQQGNGSNGAVFQQSEETKDSDGLPHPKVGGFQQTILSGHAMKYWCRDV